jgi:hypothetical protein
MLSQLLWFALLRGDTFFPGASKGHAQPRWTRSGAALDRTNDARIHAAPQQCGAAERCGGDHRGAKARAVRDRTSLCGNGYPGLRKTMALVVLLSPAGFITIA